MPPVWLMFSFMYNAALHTHPNYYLLQNNDGEIVILSNIGLTLIFQTGKNINFLNLGKDWPSGRCRTTEELLENNWLYIVLIRVFN